MTNDGSAVCGVNMEVVLPGCEQRPQCRRRGMDKSGWRQRPHGSRASSSGASRAAVSPTQRRAESKARALPQDLALYGQGHSATRLTEEEVSIPVSQGVDRAPLSRTLPLQSPDRRNVQAAEVLALGTRRREVGCVVASEAEADKVQEALQSTKDLLREVNRRRLLSAVGPADRGREVLVLQRAEALRQSTRQLRRADSVPTLIRSEAVATRERRPMVSSAPASPSGWAQASFAL